MPLHLDYRPQTFDEVIGNETTMVALKTKMSKKDKPFSYLLVGPTGCGKTTIARLIRDTLGCAGKDFLEYNTSNTRGIETIRNIQRDARLAPMYGSPCKVYLMDEAHKLTNDAQNAFLKLLEEPPKKSKVYFILCTTNPERLLPAIQNRCTTYPVELLDRGCMGKLLDWVLETEEVDDFWPTVKQRIIREAAGCPRQALVLLDNVIDLEEEQTALNVCTRVSEAATTTRELCRAVGEKNVPNRWVKTSKILIAMLEEGGVDVESVRHAILGYYRKPLLTSGDELAALIMAEFVEPFYSTGENGLILACFAACNA